MKLPLSLLFLLTLFYGGLHAETPEQLSRNVRRLVISLTLDREVYLPLEIASATVTITNPTNQTLVVPRPFDTSTGALVLAAKLEDGHWHTDEHWQPTEYDAATPTITIAPNATMQLSFRLDTKAFGAEYPAGFGLSGMPSDPNRYRLNYMYTLSPEAAFFFRVTRGDSIDHLVDVRVPAPSWAPPAQTVWYRQAAVIRQDGEYAICVTARDTNIPQLPLKWIGRPYGIGEFGLMRRIATSAVPIVRIMDWNIRRTLSSVGLWSFSQRHLRNFCVHPQCKAAFVF